MSIIVKSVFRRPATLPLLVFFALFIVYNLNGRFMGGSDVYSTRFMPVNLALRGTYYFDTPRDSIPGALAAARAANSSEVDAPPWALGTVVHDPKSPSDGRMISVYPTYTPTLLLPLYIPIYRWLKVPAEHYLTFYLDKWIASAFAAAVGMFTFALLRRLHGGRVGFALLVTAGMSLGTSLWAIASQGSWAHGPSAFYMIFGAWALERGIRRQAHPRGWVWAACAGWAMASAFATRQTDIFFVLPFFCLAVYELRRARRSLVALLSGITPVALWFCIHNYVYFGNPLTTSYHYNLAQLYIPNIMSLQNFPQGFLGLLVSPSMGVFVTAPVTLFALPGMIAAWRPSTWRASGIGADLPEGEMPTLPYLKRLVQLGTLVIVGHTLFYSCYKEWWSFWYCHRYMIDIMPFIALCIAWFFRPRARWLPLRWPLFIPALILGFMVQFYGAFFWGFVSYYNQKTISQELKLAVCLKKEELRLFDKPSCHFSLDPKQHIILSELMLFNQTWLSSWSEFKKPFISWDKMHKDLFVTRQVSFKPWPPIIFSYGQ